MGNTEPTGPDWTQVQRAGSFLLFLRTVSVLFVRCDIERERPSSRRSTEDSFPHLAAPPGYP
jgi:hypothetical protein